MSELIFSCTLFKSWQAAIDRGKGNCLSPSIFSLWIPEGKSFKKVLFTKKVLNFFFAFFSLPKLSEVAGVFSDTFKSNFEEPVSEHFCWNDWSLLTGICSIRNLLHQFQRIPVMVVIYPGCYSFFFSPMVLAFSDGLLKIEGTCCNRHNNMLSSEVATEIFRINDINCQFLLLEKKRKIVTMNMMQWHLIGIWAGQLKIRII